jgi:hypothetical protein
LANRRLDFQLLLAAISLALLVTGNAHGWYVQLCGAATLILYFHSLNQEITRLRNLVESRPAQVEKTVTIRTVSTQTATVPVAVPQTTSHP